MALSSSATATLTWRILTQEDLPNLYKAAAMIHPDLPEDDEIFAERVRIFPQGCLALVDSSSKSRELYGYTISHPISHRRTPPLNSLIRDIPPNADQYYIHDFAVLPTARGRGHAQEGLEKILQVGASFATTGLVSVYGSATFWRKYGFEDTTDLDDSTRAKISGYGAGAVYLERNNPRN